MRIGCAFGWGCLSPCLPHWAAYPRAQTFSTNKYFVNIIMLCKSDKPSIIIIIIMKNEKR